MFFVFLAPRSLRHVVSLTAGIDDDPAASLAEAFVLRGARDFRGRLAHVSEVSTSLDAVLMRERRRCVQHACIAPMPLPVPLPFPRIFSPQLSCNGDLPLTAHPAGEAPAGAEGAAASTSPEGASTGPNSAATAGEVATAPLLVKLRSTRQFEGLLGARLKDFDRAYGQQGRSIMEAWGYDGGEVVEVREALRRAAAAYQDDDADDIF